MTQVSGKSGGAVQFNSHQQAVQSEIDTWNSTRTNLAARVAHLIAQLAALQPPDKPVRPAGSKPGEDASAAEKARYNSQMASYNNAMQAYQAKYDQYVSKRNHLKSDLNRAQGELRAAEQKLLQLNAKLPEAVRRDNDEMKRHFETERKSREAQIVSAANAIEAGVDHSIEDVKAILKKEAVKVQLEGGDIMEVIVLQLSFAENAKRTTESANLITTKPAVHLPVEF